MFVFFLFLAFMVLQTLLSPVSLRHFVENTLRAKGVSTNNPRELTKENAVLFEKTLHEFTPKS